MRKTKLYAHTMLEIQLDAPKTIGIDVLYAYYFLVDFVIYIIVKQCR